MKGKCHIDCEEYLAIDVFKGFCRAKKTEVLADEASCDDFVQVMKCAFCKKFKPTDEHLGLCMDKVVTYPDLLAKTCDDFEWKDK